MKLNEWNERIFEISTHPQKYWNVIILKLFYGIFELSYYST